jgi:16S rRNA (guanine966-N2)-methyltransferase
LSRGARHAIFVEIDRECIGLIIKNVQALRYEDRARVRHADAYRWARTFEPEGTDPVVVLLDPPYVDYERRHKLLNQTIAHVVERLPGGSVIVLEAGQGLNDRILPLVETWDVRRYGNTQVAIKMIESAAMDAVASPDDAERASGANRDRSETEDDLRR